MKLLMKDTIFKFLRCNTPVKNISGEVLEYYNIQVPHHLQKILDDRFNKSKNQVISFIGYYCYLYNKEEIKIFYEVINDKLESNDFSSIDNFIKNIFIDIPEEELFYLKLKYPHIFKG